MSTTRVSCVKDESSLPRVFLSELPMSRDLLLMAKSFFFWSPGYSDSVQVEHCYVNQQPKKWLKPTPLLLDFFSRYAGDGEQRGTAFLSFAVDIMSNLSSRLSVSHRWIVLSKIAWSFAAFAFHCTGCLSWMSSRGNDDASTCRRSSFS